ncbi:mechanosensitive ion channel family protein [Corynebacterium choanae]|nr:mechanosensitive ion channel family protein [Corynebacterium choanae]
MPPVGYLLDNLWRWAADTGIPLAIVVIIALLVPRIGRFAIRLIENRLIDFRSNEAKSHLALVGTAVYLAQIIIYVFLLILALQILGFSTTGIAIPATVLSAALGFGAQSIIADFLAGFFILTERQFGLGDWVRFQGNGIDVQGDVMKITMRAVHMRTLAGETVIIPNSTARVCINHSNNWARAVVVIPVPLLGSESMAEVVERCVAAGKRALADPVIAEDITGELEVHPPLGLTQPTAVGQPWMVNMRFLVRTYPLCQWAVERTIRTYVVDEFWADYGSATTAEGLIRPTLEEAPEPIASLPGVFGTNGETPVAPASSTDPQTTVLRHGMTGAHHRLTAAEEDTLAAGSAMTDQVSSTADGAQRDAAGRDELHGASHIPRHRVRSARAALKAAAGKHSPDKSPMGPGGGSRKPRDTPPDMGPGAGIALIRPERFNPDGTPEDVGETTWLSIGGKKKQAGTGLLSLGGRVRNSTTVLVAMLIGLLLLDGLTYQSENEEVRGVLAPPPAAYQPQRTTTSQPAPVSGQDGQESEPADGSSVSSTASTTPATDGANAGDGEKDTQGSSTRDPNNPAAGDNPAEANQPQPGEAASTTSSTTSAQPATPEEPSTDTGTTSGSDTGTTTVDDGAPVAPAAESAPPEAAAPQSDNAAE